jgi:hypothetical protein
MRILSCYWSLVKFVYKHFMFGSIMVRCACFPCVVGDVEMQLVSLWKFSPMCSVSVI